CADRRSRGRGACVQPAARGRHLEHGAPAGAAEVARAHGCRHPRDFPKPSIQNDRTRLEENMKSKTNSSRHRTMYAVLSAAALVALFAARIAAQTGGIP